MPSFIRRGLAAIAFTFAFSGAHAADLTFSGQLAYHNAVAAVGFTLDQDSTGVKLWTDSYQDGLNFDPYMTLWQFDINGNAWVMIKVNDDNPSIAPGQTAYDSGLTPAFLLAGQYLVTIAAYPNTANGPWLSDGFLLDGETPVPMSTWVQPDHDAPAGGNWQLHLSNVDTAAVAAVPEPDTYALLIAGLLLVGTAVTRRLRHE